MFLFIALLSTLACIAAATSSADSASLRSTGLKSGNLIQAALVAKATEAFNALPKDLKAQAVVTPMASATVPTSYAYITGCGNSQAAALPLGICFPYSGSYAMWTQTTVSGVNTLSIGAYSENTCTTPAMFTSEGLSGSCSTSGNTFSVGASSSKIPAVPSGAGVVENFYITAGCGSLAGFFFTPQGSCIADEATYSVGTCSSSSVSITYFTAGTTVCTSSGGTAVSQPLYSSCTAIVGSAAATSPYLGVSVGLVFGGNYFSDTCQAAASTDAAVCFAGSETVTLASGESKAIADVTVGDSVLAYSVASGKTIFSDVIATPHPRNNVAAEFQHIVTDAGSDIKMTADHLILSGACSTELPLVRAADVQTGACIQTVSGQEVVASNEVVLGEGLYTVIPEKGDHLVVVNNIVASPFAVNHAVGNAVYAIHRLAYTVAPALMASSAFKAVNTVASNLAAYFTK